jgi:hypothetical protein
MFTAKRTIKDNNTKYKKLRSDLYKAVDTLNNSKKEYEKLNEDIYEAVDTAFDQAIKAIEDEIAGFQRGYSGACEERDQRTSRIEKRLKLTKMA